MTNDKDYVTFEDSSGNEISNDPRWHAERILGLQGDNAGVEDAQRAAELAELEELREFKRTHGVAQPPVDPKFGDDADDEDEDDEEDEETEAPGPYDSVKGKALSELAKTREIDIKGPDGKNLTAGAVRAALEAQDLGRASA